MSTSLEARMERLTAHLDQKFPKNNFSQRLKKAYPHVEEIPIDLYLKYILNLSEAMREHLQQHSRDALYDMRMRLSQDYKMRNLTGDTTELLFWSLINSFSYPTQTMRSSHSGNAHWLPHCYLKYFTVVKSFDRKIGGKRLRFTKVNLTKINGNVFISTQEANEISFVEDKTTKTRTIEDACLELFHSKLESNYSHVMVEVRSGKTTPVSNWERAVLNAFVAAHYLRVSPEATLHGISRTQWHSYRGPVGNRNLAKKMIEIIEQLSEYSHTTLHKAERLLPLTPTHLPTVIQRQGTDSFFFPVSSTHAVVFSTGKLNTEMSRKIEDMYISSIKARAKKYGYSFFMRPDVTQEELIKFAS